MTDKPTWVFDAPTGTYRCPELSEALIRRSWDAGPILPIYAAIILPRFVTISTIHDSADTLRTLVYQARYLRQITPFDPHLRACVPSNYGRTQSVAWYNEHLDRLLLPAGGRFHEINPEEIL